MSIAVSNWTEFKDAKMGLAIFREFVLYVTGRMLTAYLVCEGIAAEGMRLLT